MNKNRIFAAQREREKQRELTTRTPSTSNFKICLGRICPAWINKLSTQIDKHCPTEILATDGTENFSDNRFFRQYLSLEELFSTCDVVYLCLSISDETKNIITDELLNKLKKNCIFISCTGKSLFNSILI